MVHCTVLQERKEKTKKVKYTTDKCPVGLGSERMGSNLGLFSVLPYLLVPEDIGRKGRDLWKEHNRPMSLTSLLS